MDYSYVDVDCTIDELDYQLGCVAGVDNKLIWTTGFCGLLPCFVYNSCGPLDVVV
jgi:hypothetical protein